MQSDVAKFSAHSLEFDAAIKEIVWLVNTGSVLFAIHYLDKSISNGQEHLGRRAKIERKNTVKEDPPVQSTPNTWLSYVYTGIWQ